MTTSIQAYRLADNRWEEEAACLQSLIKVGSIDTFSIGCIASDIVLYVSLVVILAVIFIKFFMAVVFGWFLSWKLGHFNEDKDYAARMRREAEIENWTRNMDAPAPYSALQPNNPYANNKKQNRKTLLPQTSRYTKPEHGMHHFDINGMGGGSPSSVSVAALANNSSTWNPSAPNPPFMSRASMIRYRINIARPMLSRNSLFLFLAYRMALVQIGLTLPSLEVRLLLDSATTKTPAETDFLLSRPLVCRLLHCLSPVVVKATTVALSNARCPSHPSPTLNHLPTICHSTLSSRPRFAW